MLKIQKTFIESCLVILLLTTLFLLLSVSASGQEPADPQFTQPEVASRNEAAETRQPSVAIPTAPVYQGFMGVTLGMAANEVRERLGHLKDKGEHQDLFVFSKTRSAQVFYDQGKVNAISVDYVVKGGEAPTPESVLGESVQAKPDGSMYELKRYPAAGYWVAYSRTAGDSPIVTVTMQEI
jgi:hypothetical protein